MRERGAPQPAADDGLPHARSLFPFTGAALSQRGARRRAAARPRRRRDARAGVPRRRCRCTCRSTPRCRSQCDSALPLLEAIEQRAARAGVAVDSRIERGRTYRHAIRQLVEHEHFDTIVVTAGDAGSPGLLPDDDQLAARARRRARSS